MKRTLALLIAGVAGALIALFALTFASAALAQGPGGPPAQTMPGAGPGGRGPMMGGRDDSLVGIAAAELGISQAELVGRLGAGRSIADLLSEAGVDPALVVDGFVAARAERLAAAVAAGRLTQTAADARLADLRAMAEARIAEPFAAHGPGFVDEDGDGVCDLMPAGGPMPGHRGGRGPRR